MLKFLKLKIWKKICNSFVYGRICANVVLKCSRGSDECSDISGFTVVCVVVELVLALGGFCCGD